MKSFKEYINRNDIDNNINESGETAADYISAVSNALPELLDEIEKKLKCKKGIIKLFPSVTRNNAIRIESNDLTELTGEIGKTLYKLFTLETWGGYLKNNKIWWEPNWNFKYHNGGSNGTTALWTTIEFDITTNKWNFY